MERGRKRRHLVPAPGRPLSASPYQWASSPRTVSEVLARGLPVPIRCLRERGPGFDLGTNPSGKPGAVIVERKTGNTWVTAARLRPTATASSPLNSGLRPTARPPSERGSPPPRSCRSRSRSLFRRRGRARPLAAAGPSAARERRERCDFRDERAQARTADGIVEAQAAPGQRLRRARKWRTRSSIRPAPPRSQANLVRGAFTTPLRGDHAIRQDWNPSNGVLGPRALRHIAHCSAGSHRVGGHCLGIPGFAWDRVRRRSSGRCDSRNDDRDERRGWSHGDDGRRDWCRRSVDNPDDAGPHGPLRVTGVVSAVTPPVAVSLRRSQRRSRPLLGRSPPQARPSRR